MCGPFGKDMCKRAVCTVVTKNYLSYARVLAESTKKYNPNIDVYVLLADQVDSYFNPSQEPFNLIRLEDLPESRSVIEQMCFYYTPFELCCALRGVLHEYMLICTDAEKWLFLDSDVLVYNSLSSIFDELDKTTVLLTPHNTRATTLEKTNDFEVNFLIGGIYNAGFLGVNRNASTLDFIAWFKERLRHFSFDNIAIGDSLSIFVDQLWLNLVPLYFDCRLLLDPGANLGHWNLWNKTLSLDCNGKLLINGRSILFIHFSGWDISCPGTVSRHSKLYKSEDYRLWAVVGNLYRDRLQANGYEITRTYPYAFARFDTGEKIPREARRAYYHEVREGIKHQHSPFLQAKHFLDKPYPHKTSVYYLQKEINRLQQELEDVKSGIFPWYDSYRRVRLLLKRIAVKVRIALSKAPKNE